MVRRWIAVFTPATLDVDDPATMQAWVNDQCQDSARVARYRERLQNLGWFMKALKEPLARIANKEDDCVTVHGLDRVQAAMALGRAMVGSRDGEGVPAKCAVIASIRY